MNDDPYAAPQTRRRYFGQRSPFWRVLGNVVAAIVFVVGGALLLWMLANPPP
jgi:hypothetical protein